MDSQPFSTLFPVPKMPLRGIQAERVSAYVSEQTQHLIVGGIIWQRISACCRTTGSAIGHTRDEETQICIAQDRRNANQASSSTRHDADIFPTIQAILALPMVLVIQPRDCRSQRFDAGGGAVFAPCERDIDGFGPLEGPFDIILDFRGTLSQVCP
jgi:hypothetical protein